MNNRVLLPGVTTLARMVAAVRQEENDRLHATLYEAVPYDLRTEMVRLLEVPEKKRVSELERLRMSPMKVSGKAMQMEDQFGALGLALNAVALFNSLYIDAAVKQLASDGFPSPTSCCPAVPAPVRPHQLLRPLCLHPAAGAGPAAAACPYREDDTGDGGNG